MRVEITDDQIGIDTQCLQMPKSAVAEDGEVIFFQILADSIVVSDTC